ncbi:MAG: hypothetical protein U0930_11165 [Pirellulales bacterium]
MLDRGWSQSVLMLEREPDSLFTTPIAVYSQIPATMTVTHPSGVDFDLFDQSGVKLASKVQAADLRNLKAGRYFIKGHSAGGTRQVELMFSAPEAGQTRAGFLLNDRDIINGNDGNDVMIGNDDLDQLTGGLGVDSFDADEIEIRDIQTDNIMLLPVSQSMATPNSRPLDPFISISDFSLRMAVASELGIATTWSGKLAQSYEPATCLLTKLVVSNINSLDGIEYATNLNASSK